MRRSYGRRSVTRPMSRAYSFTVVIEQDEDGLFVASCSVLQGCHTQAKTYEGAVKNIREAIQGALEARSFVGDPLPHEVGAEKVIVMAEA